MPSVEELLEGDNEEQNTNGDSVLVIDPDTRTINLPTAEILFGVETDKDVERKYFRCPKIVGDNIDLSQHRIYIAYIMAKNANGTDFANEGAGLYYCDDLETDGENITFSWLLSGNALKTPGFLAFKVLAKYSINGETKTRWNTAPAVGTVLLTVPDGEEIAEQYPDVIEQLFDAIEGLTQISPEDVSAAVAEYMAANPINVPTKLSDLQDDTEHRTVTDVEKEAWDGKSDFSGSYNDLRDKPSIPQPVSKKTTMNREVGMSTNGRLYAADNKILTIYQGGITIEYDGTGAAEITVPGVTERIEKTSTDTTVELQPNTLYVFPEMAELSLTFAAPTNTAIVNEYHVIFQSGATPTMLTIPETVKVPDSLTMESNKVYELSVMEDCLSYQSWEVTA